VLAAEQLEEFEEHGFVRVPGAFPRDAAAAMELRLWHWLEKHHGALRRRPRDEADGAGGRPAWPEAPRAGASV
jgi:hypothetical protein